MLLNLTSAAGIIALLEEPESEVKVFALKKLDQISPVFWAEISEAIDRVEMLYEDEAFKQRDLAALVASKVYYHLGAFDDSLNYALGAASLFDVNDTSEYVETIIAKCIDYYTRLRTDNASLPDSQQKKIDARLESIVDRMFERCLDDKQYRQAVGIALETRRVDVFERAILSSPDVAQMLNYAFRVCMTLVSQRAFRDVILRVLVRLYMNLETSDYINVCQCLIFLDDAPAVAEILDKLIRSGSEHELLMAYQIGFDLYESATQQFLLSVIAVLKSSGPSAVADPISDKNSSEDAKSTSEQTESDAQSMETEQAETADDKDTKDEPVKGDAESTAGAQPPESEVDKVLREKYERLHVILGGETTINLHLQFLIRNNKSDLLILRNTKEAVRNSICHNATVMANAFMHAGTTSDQFLRDNLDWLSRATNWAKFAATASLGVIHHGHEQDSLGLMAAYLPKETGGSGGTASSASIGSSGVGGSTYSEGGGLYALGLIHANHGGHITDYLLTQLKEATTDMVRHGGCLGVGLAAMGTARQDVYEQLKFNLYQDDAVSGEAAGLAMGLVMLGTASSSAVDDMVSYAQETQHEKILRGLALGIALTMYARMEQAEPLIDSLARDKDPILRWSGMYTLAMAYCGSGNNAAIRRLLHVAVSDVSDDVRRVAVTCLGFLLFRTPEQCPSVVSLLSESYNPHVRYGAAMALGIACAGTGLKEAIGLLEPMTEDPVNYVRQGALVASAMVLVQLNETICPKVATFRALYAKVIADKHEDLMAKFGAILAQGIIDGGGRNSTLSLQSGAGHVNMCAVVGVLVFCQFWFWYPLTYFLCLAYAPTCVVALNGELQMPKNVKLRSRARPSLYAYPPPLEDKKEKSREKVETAVLSTTHKQKRKEAEKSKGKESGEGKEKKSSEKKETADSKNKDAEMKPKDSEKDEEKMDVDEEAKDVGKEKTDVSEKDAAMSEASEKMDQDSSSTKDSATPMEVPEDGKAEAEKKDETKKTDSTSEEKKTKKQEPTFEILSNPARVMRAQLKVISLSEGCRYQPLKDISNGGIILMQDTKPESGSDEMVEPVIAGGPKVGVASADEEDEPEPPEPFEWTDE